MKFVVLFVVLFVGILNIISCSILPDIMRICCSGIKNNPKMYEELAKHWLEMSVAENGTIFLKSMPLVLSKSKENSSENQEYAALMNGLDGYLKHYALATIIKSRNGKLSRNERTSFINEMNVVANEDANFASHSLENFTYSPKTLEFIFTALKAIDPLATDTLNLTSKFVKYCKTDLQLKEPLSMILHALESTLRNIPSINFNPKLNETTEYDNFIRTLNYTNCFNAENAVLLAKNIIYGPISVVTTNILYSIGLQPIIEQICINDADLNQMIRHVFGSNSYSRFSRFIASNPSNSPIITEIRAKVDHQQKNLEVIYEFINYDHFGDNDLTNLENFLDLFDNRSKALEEYYKIDSRFVERSLLIINSRIASLIQHAHKLASSLQFNAAMLLIIQYFKILPSIRLEQDLSDNFNQFLDLMMNPLTDENRLLVPYSKLIKNAVLLPYIKIDCFVLQKIYRIYLAASPVLDVVTLTDSIFLLIVFNKNIDDKFSIFEEIHKFKDLESLSMESVAFSAIFMANSQIEKSLTTKIFDYSLENHLISKTFILAGNFLLKRFSRYK